MMAVLPWANASLEAPAFALSNTVGTSFTDFLLRPIDLGWHTKRADVTTGFQFYIPTGRSELGGTTMSARACGDTSPSSARRSTLMRRGPPVSPPPLSGSCTGKKDTNIKVGQILALEGGMGNSFLKGGLVLGGAYYAQWKLTKDPLADLVLPSGEPIAADFPNKHKVFALGPDVTFPIASKSRLYSLVNIRYFWELGVRTKTEGQNLVVTATFPVPSLRLQCKEPIGCNSRRKSFRTRVSRRLRHASATVKF